MATLRVTTSKVGRTLRFGTHRHSFLPSDPRDPRTGGAWDLQALAWYLPRKAGGDALFAGVGGGTVPRIVRRIVGGGYPVGPYLWGIDYERVLDVARAEMDLDGIRWMGLYGHGLRMFLEEFDRCGAGWPDSYDFVVDDVFDVLTSGKPRMLSPRHYLALMRLVRPRGGHYVANLMQRDVRWYRPLVRQMFPTVIQLEHEDLANAVVIGTSALASAATLRASVESSGMFDELLRKVSMRTIQSGR